MINVSLIGFGAWGKNIYKCLNENSKINLQFICKKNNKDLVNSVDKNILVYDYKKAFNKETSLIFIATPAETHFKIASYFLKQKKHIFVEKPISLNNKEFIKMINLAEENKVAIHTNYIHLYNDNFLKFKNENIIFKNSKNKISSKLILGNNGPIRNGSSAFCDWAPHVYSMLSFFYETKNLKIKKIKFFYDKKIKNKFNVYIKFKIESFEVSTLFGNNMKSKICKFQISDSVNKNIYLDKETLIYKNNKPNKYAYETKPLDNSINQFLLKVDNNNNNNNKEEEHLSNITKEIMEFKEQYLYKKKKL